MLHSKSLFHGRMSRLELRLNPEHDGGDWLQSKHQSASLNLSHPLTIWLSRVDINNQLAQSPGPVPPSLKNHPTAELDSDMWTCSLLGQTYLRSTSNRNQERKKVGHQSLQRETQAIDVDRVDQP